LPVDLNSLLLDLTALDDAQAEQRGRAEYKAQYVPEGRRGAITAYDGSLVYFFEDRFDHAFFTTNDRYTHQFAKNVLARERVARIGWIGPILRGEVPNTQCWQSQRSPGNDQLQRLCVASSELYVVWLESRNDGAWRFSSAYNALGAQVSDYTRGKGIVWKT